MSPPSGQLWTELEQFAYLRENPLTESSCLKVSPDGKRMCIKERGHPEPCDETAQPFSGQYGELKEAAIEAARVGTWAFSVEDAEVVEAAHPIYVAALEAQAQEIAAIESLISYWSNSLANPIHKFDAEAETPRKWLEAREERL